MKTERNIELIPDIAITESGFEIKVRMNEDQINEILDLKLLIKELQKTVGELSEKIISFEKKNDETEQLYIPPTRKSRFDEVKPDRHALVTYRIKEAVEFIDENLHGDENSFAPFGKLLKKFAETVDISPGSATNTTKYVEIIRKYYADFFKCKKTYNGRALIWSIAKLDDNMLF